jgi:hypothetical protein
VTHATIPRGICPQLGDQHAHHLEVLHHPAERLPLHCLDFHAYHCSDVGRKHLHQQTVPVGVGKEVESTDILDTLDGEDTLAKSGVRICLEVVIENLRPLVIGVEHVRPIVLVVNQQLPQGQNSVDDSRAVGPIGDWHVCLQGTIGEVGEPVDGRTTEGERCSPNRELFDSLCHLPICRALKSKSLWIIGNGRLPISIEG